jgi:hypothetical protein
MSLKPRVSYFSYLVGNIAFIRPDLGNASSISLLECGVICAVAKTCTTFSYAPGHVGRKRFICQLSHREGVCMERDEAIFEKRSRIFQKKVNIPANRVSQLSHCF